MSDSKLVDFLVVGAQKSGTTSLYAYLKEYSEIEMSIKKEVHFFNNNEYFQSEYVDYQYYHSFFNFSEKKISGEATPAYMFCRDAPKRIWQYNPNMKIVVILRNPIERAFSHWNMEFSRGAEELEFSEAIRREQYRCREALPEQHYTYSYLERGRYSAQLRELWRFFPKKQVLILKYRELKLDPCQLLAKLYSFLGGWDSEAFDCVGKVLNKGGYLSEISAQDKIFLEKHFEFEILELGRMLGWKVGEW